MYLLGTILIISGIAAAMLASVSYALVPNGHAAALAYGRFGTRAALGAVLLVVALPLSRSLYLGVLGLFRIRSTRPANRRWCSDFTTQGNTRGGRDAIPTPVPLLPVRRRYGSHRVPG